jgi:hypothetical protein
MLRRSSFRKGCRRCTLVFSHCFAVALGFHAGLCLASTRLDKHAVVADAALEGMAMSPLITEESPTAATTVAMSSSLPMELPDSIRRVFRHALLVPRDDFVQHLDVLPFNLDTTQAGNEQVLLLSRSDAAPASLDDCHVLKVVTIQPSAPKSGVSKNVCLGVLGQWETPHAHNYQQRNTNDSRNNVTVTTTTTTSSLWTQAGHPQGAHILLPSSQTRDKYRHEILTPYLQRRADTLARLAPIVRQVARTQDSHDSSDNINASGQLVVLVCNQGQLKLLHNFACHARAHGVSLQHVLVFCTDTATFEFVTRRLQLAAFDVKDALGIDLPTQAAKTTSDKKFAAMVLAKVLVADLLSSLPYDFLWQDVDIVWYKDPLPWFAAMAVSNQNGGEPYDLVFQDDGSRTLSANGLSANTGCYYARATERTRHYFASLVGLGENILEQRIDQPFMNERLHVHMNLNGGLRVKIVSSRDETVATPTGWHFKRKPSYMRRWLFDGMVQPILYHNNWTRDKLEKILVFQQLGAWYVPTSPNATSTTLTTTCLAKPIVECHFAQFPSRVPCSKFADWSW